jgi:putative transposon-encoded protein
MEEYPKRYPFLSAKRAWPGGFSDVAEEKYRNESDPDDDGESSPGPETGLSATDPSSRVKFEIFGEEMIEKRVKASGNSGRVYLPPDWVGHKVKIIRID